MCVCVCVLFGEQSSGGCQRGMIYKVETSLKCAGVCGRDPGGEGERRKPRTRAGWRHSLGWLARVGLEPRGGRLSGEGGLLQTEPRESSGSGVPPPTLRPPPTRTRLWSPGYSLGVKMSLCLAVGPWLSFLRNKMVKHQAPGMGSRTWGFRFRSPPSIYATLRPGI